jgi:hypothetical protein
MVKLPEEVATPETVQYSIQLGHSQAHKRDSKREKLLAIQIVNGSLAIVIRSEKLVNVGGVIVDIRHAGDNVMHFVVATNRPGMKCSE